MESLRTSKSLLTSSNDNGSNALISIKLEQGVIDFMEQSTWQRVQSLWAVQGDKTNLSLLLRQDILIASISGSAACVACIKKNKKVWG